MSDSKISVWIMAARPRTLWAAVGPVMIGSAMAFERGLGHWPSVAATLFGALMIQIGANLANDYFDFKKGADTAERLGPTRVTQAGLVTAKEMKRAIVFAFALSAIAGIYLVFRGGWPIVTIGLTSILFGILYTAGPYPLGYHGLGDPFAFLFFGPVAVGGTYYAQTLSINPEVIIAGLAPGLFAVCILTVNNIRDLKSDTVAGKRTLAVRFGVRFARMEYLLAFLVAVLIPVFLYLTSGRHPYSMAVLAVLPNAIGPIRKLYKFTDPRELNDLLAVTGRLLMMYAVFFSIGWLL